MQKINFIIILLLLLRLASGQIIPSSYYTLVTKADSLYEKKDFSNSALTYHSAFRILGNKGKIIDRYNAAKAWANNNNKDSAFYNLDLISERTFFSDYDKTINEPSFAILHTDQRWKPLIEKIKQNSFFKPTFWLKSETKENYYKVGIAKDTLQNDKIIGTIKCSKNKSNKQCSYMTFFEPIDYLNSRIKFTGRIKCKNVSGYSCFWIRVDGSNINKPLAYADTKSQNIKGTTEWTDFEILIEVSDEATKIVFGGLLKGSGQMWFDNLKFEKTK